MVALQHAGQPLRHLPPQDGGGPDLVGLALVGGERQDPGVAVLDGDRSVEPGTDRVGHGEQVSGWGLTSLSRPDETTSSSASSARSNQAAWIHVAPGANPSSATLLPTAAWTHPLVDVHRGADHQCGCLRLAQLIQQGRDLGGIAHPTASTIEWGDPRAVMGVIDRHATQLRCRRRVPDHQVEQGSPPDQRQVAVLLTELPRR